MAPPGVKPNLPVIPQPDRPRVRPCMVQQNDGSAVIYVELVVPPAEVHAMYTSVKALRRSTETMGLDTSQAVYDFVMRTRGTYFEGRIKPL